MVAKHSPFGLIAATRADLTPSLDELVAHCRWPLLLEANPRRLERELSLHNPECVLFWLEDRHSVDPTARLIAWSRMRSARPYRVAVAYRMDADVEAVFRAAGAHSFLPIDKCSGAAIAGTLWPLLEVSVRSAAEKATAASPMVTAGDRVAALELPSDLVRPP